MRNVAASQEFMYTLECFFSEWFAEDDGTAWGRVPVSNDTAAVQRSMRWGGVGFQANPLHLTSGQEPRVLRVAASLRPEVQVTPWCVELVQSTRICHIRSNLGFDWAENVWPVFLNISGKPTDFMVRAAAGLLQHHACEQDITLHLGDEGQW